MKRIQLFSLLKRFFSSSKSETYILISGGLTGFFIIFIINAVLGFYSIFGISADISENLTGVNLARNTQLALHEQVLAWENILVTGGEFTGFRKSYHEFSAKSDSVQNLLFDLKLHYAKSPDLSADIDRLRGMHKKITGDFTAHIVEMNEKNFTNIREKVALTGGIEDELLSSLNDVVLRIEESGEKKNLFINGRYMIITALSSIIFIALIIYYGRQIGKRIIKTHNILESMVQHRTREYVEANLALTKEIEEHKVTERHLITSRNEIEEKNRLLTASEKRYRLIVEGTKDVIFTLDDNWHFKSANDAIKRELKIKPDSAPEYNFIDLICDDLTDANVLRRIITEKLEESKKAGKTIKFNAQLKTPDLIEPVEFKISIEFIENEGGREILGKAIRLTDDRFTESFISEKCEYMIRNLLFEADDISHRITNNLQKYIDKTDINMIRIGLREIIINSIEHGNLNISFEEKTEAMMTDRYFDFINERRLHPENREKRVKIEYLISPSRAIYKITDQGKGFNHRKFLAGVSEENADTGLAHGRGIAMVKNIFDEVKYNFRGNQVLLVKHLNKEKDVEEDGSDREIDEIQRAEVG